MESKASPVATATDLLGGARILAQAVGVTPSMVSQWSVGHRPVAADKCVLIERATEGRVTVEGLRSDLTWSRIADPTWPHPAGRPVIDVARPVAVQEVV